LYHWKYEKIEHEIGFEMIRFSYVKIKKIKLQVQSMINFFALLLHINWFLWSPTCL